MKRFQDRIQYFASDVDSTLVKIIVCAVVFHLAIVAICIAFHYVNVKTEPEQIPVFEMVQVSQPKPPSPPRTQPPPPKPKPKPKVNKKLPPDIKPEPEEKREEVFEDPKPPEP